MPQDIGAPCGPLTNTQFWREVARLRLEYKRRQRLRDQMNREEHRDGTISPSRWEQWEDLGAGIADMGERIFSQLGLPLWTDRWQQRCDALDQAAGMYDAPAPERSTPLPPEGHHPL